MSLSRFPIAVAMMTMACPGAPVRPEGLDPSSLPEGTRADYAVFAQRCSKCHSLARPLDSGIDDDEYWERYVARMRRQPGSGISPADTVPILRFLHDYALEQRERKESRAAAKKAVAQPPAATPAFPPLDAAAAEAPDADPEQRQESTPPGAKPATTPFDSAGATDRSSQDPTP